MHFKDSNGGLHFLSHDDVAKGGLSLLPPGAIEIGEDEARAIREANSAKSLPQMMADVRYERDRLLRDVYDPAAHMLLRLQRTAPSELQPAIAAKLAELDAYAQALQTVPEQPGFPHEVEWPTVPAKEL